MNPWPSRWEPWGGTPGSTGVTRVYFSLPTSRLPSTSATVGRAGTRLVDTGLVDNNHQGLWECPRLPADSDKLQRVEIHGAGLRERGEAAVPTIKESEAHDEITERLIDHHVDRVRRWLDGDTPGGALAEGFMLLPFEDFLDQYVPDDEERQEPPLHIIVQIARRTRSLISDLCKRPRKNLRRERQLTGLSKVQDVDSACLRWLARQPGTTLAEQAGPKQQVLAVTRQQSVDTPENRVLRDFLRLSVRAGRHYCKTYREFTESKRIEHVRRFTTLIQRILQTSEIAHVPRLSGTPTANYVLQFDSRYKQLWHWHQRLRKQEQEKEDLVAWQHRVWSERTMLLMARACAGLADPLGSFAGTAHLRTKAGSGRFLEERVLPGPWSIPGSSSGDLLRLLGQSDVAEHGSDRVRRLAGLCPDHVLTMEPALRSGQARRALAVFSLFSPFETDESVRGRLARLEEAVASLSEPGVGGLLLVPRGEGTQVLAQSPHALATACRLPIGSAEHAGESFKGLRRILKSFATEQAS